MNQWIYSKHGLIWTTWMYFFYYYDIWPSLISIWGPCVFYTIVILHVEYGLRLLGEFPEQILPTRKKSISFVLLLVIISENVYAVAILIHLWFGRTASYLYTRTFNFLCSLYVIVPFKIIVISYDCVLSRCSSFFC